MQNHMVEAEWEACGDPWPMLRLCRRLIQDQPRKGRLFAVACCERIGHLLGDPRSREAVEVAAQYAEGLATDEQLRLAASAGANARGEALRARGKALSSAEWAAQYAAAADPWFAATRASNFAYVAAGDGLEPGPEHRAQAVLLRCVFGPLPFRPVVVEPAWRAWNDGTTRLLALEAYETGAFDRLPILGDALEEAGCTDPAILSHCRQPAPHTRGCFVLDLILGRS